MNNYKELQIWKKSMIMVKMVYELMESMPASENYGLSQQIKRSAVSIPSNIAEGASRSSDKEFMRFLHYSNGSMAELLTQLELTISLDFMQGDQSQQVSESIHELQKMTYSLIKRMKE